MKLIDILEDLNGTTTPTDDMGFADDVDKRTAGCPQAPDDFKGAARITRNGKNGKKARQIASNAKTKAKEANPGDSETISQHGPNASHVGFRIGS